MTEKKKTVSVLDDVQLFETYEVELTFRDKLMAGLPKQEESLEFFMNSKHMSNVEKDDFKKRVMEGVLTKEEKEDRKAAGCRIFEKDGDGHLCIWHHNIKAMMRECAVVLGITQLMPSRVKEKKHAGGKQTMQHGLHIEPMRIKILVGDKPMKVPTGSIDRIQHITDMSGTRSVISKFDYVDNPTLNFEVSWPGDGCLEFEHLKKILKLAERDGLGASRSQGFGKFIVTKLQRKK